MNIAEHISYMELALTEARKALSANEVPVGAVVRLGDEVIARAYDLREHSFDPTAHAELLALRQAAVRLGDWRLNECMLYTTLEPCPMCAGALILARIKCLVYGASNFKFGAVATKCKLLDCAEFNHRVEVVAGVLSEECSALMSNFFALKRQK